MKQSAVIGIVGALVCAWAIWECARVGVARTNSLDALHFNDVAAAQRSVQQSANDAEVHAARGVVLQRTENYAEACRELERAIQLRPRDYFLWMMLGVTRDLNDDQTGGLAALRQAVTLAPSYAKPRWLIGNLLLRMGETDEAFQQLRFAAETDPTLLPNVIDLAWGMSRNDSAGTVALIQPQTDKTRSALAIFLASHKQGAAALQQFRNVKSPAVSSAVELIQRLIEARSFPESYEVWKQTHCPGCKPAAVVNPGFEEDIDVGERGFGWQIFSGRNVTLSIDTAEHEQGARSLRADFHGESDTANPLVSQFILVQPGLRYRLTFQAMTKSLVSAGALVVTVVDASDDKRPALGQSPGLSETEAWRPSSVDFATSANTHAVQVRVTRQGCPGAACATFGTLWLDSFVLSAATNQSAGR